MALKILACLVISWTLLAGNAAGGCSGAGFAVALDAGHSADTVGARSASGRGEHFMNMAVAEAALAALRAAGFSRSFIVNPGGESLTLAERGERAAAGGARLLLSIHHDSVQPHLIEEGTRCGEPAAFCDRFRGFSIFVSERNARARESSRLGRFLGEEMLRAGFSPTLHHADPVEGEGRPLMDARIGLYRWDGLGVVRKAPMAAALLECGVIVHREEDRALREEAARERIARAVARAVTRLCEEFPRPRDSGAALTAPPIPPRRSP